MSNAIRNRGKRGRCASEVLAFRLLLLPCWQHIKMKLNNNISSLRTNELTQWKKNQINYAIMCIFVVCACILHALSLWQNHLFCWHRRHSRCRHRCRCYSATRFIIFPFFFINELGVRSPFTCRFQCKCVSSKFLCFFLSFSNRISKIFFFSRADVTADSFVNFFSFFYFFLLLTDSLCVCVCVRAYCVRARRK